MRGHIDVCVCECVLCMWIGQIGVCVFVCMCASVHISVIFFVTFFHSGCLVFLTVILFQLTQPLDVRGSSRLWAPVKQSADAQWLEPALASNSRGFPPRPTQLQEPWQGAGGWPPLHTCPMAGYHPCSSLKAMLM